MCSGLLFNQSDPRAKGKALGINNMGTTLTPSQALETLIKNLKKSKEDELWAEIDLLKATILSSTNQENRTFWDNPTTNKRIKEAMKASWAARKPSFRLSWRSSGQEVTTQDLDQISKLVGKTVNTFRTSMSIGKGRAVFSHNDDVITVVKIPKATTSLQ